MCVSVVCISHVIYMDFTEKKQKPKEVVRLGSLSAIFTKGNKLLRND